MLSIKLAEGVDTMNAPNNDIHEFPLGRHLNGSVDFTQSSDFAKMYEMSCSIKTDHSDQSPIREYISMEPDVSITVVESNMEKTINHVATGMRISLSTVKKKRDSPGTSKSVNKKMNGKFRQKLENCTNPGVKFQCYKCSGSDFSSIHELTAHQRKCIGSAGLESESTVAQVSPKTTRKVYLCSACGTYYENWNLFLHMKEVHKRHICLYCLGMFSQPDKLAQHLQAKHNIVEQPMQSLQAFYNAYKGPCHLVCCGCEMLMTDQNKFHEHSCPANVANVSNASIDFNVPGGSFYCQRSGQSAFNVFPPKKSKKKSSKRKRDIFKIVNLDSPSALSVTVRKQPQADKYLDGPDPVGYLGDDSAIRQFNEKLLQLYRPSKPPDKIISSSQSIEDSINRVIENLYTSNGGTVVAKEDKPQPAEEEEEEEDTNMPTPEKVPTPDECITKAEDITMEPADLSQPEQAGSFGKDEDTKKGVTEVTETPRHKSFLHEPSDNESTDSEKLTIALEPNQEKPNVEGNEEYEGAPDEGISAAGPETAYIYVHPLDGIDLDCVRTVLKACIKVSCWNCVYCAHAKRVAVNGWQLALHVLTEHRFVLGPEDLPEDVKAVSVARFAQQLKDSATSLQTTHFNADTFDSADMSSWKQGDRIYECYHCLFATYIHKELCSHNRKMHQKNVFLCIMCKLSFYNYSELLCHLCPGIYVPGQVINPEMTYRCYACDTTPLPSAFRLMVHLRKIHNACDICFDVSGSQLQLSTHVWKHKQAHMCYRCGIAYRNKPDITKHLFWKHGTESVLCKRCLQKKWPHVYHFCVPPNSFLCDECTISLKSAVALKVHKRLHSNQFPYSCDKCEDKFISRKLLNRHMLRHEEEEKRTAEEPSVDEEDEEEEEEAPEKVDEGAASQEKSDEKVNVDHNSETPTKAMKKSRKKKELSDLFDLPPVNLSESDDSDQDEVPAASQPPRAPSPPLDTPANGDLDKDEPAPQVVDGVWDDFKHYMERGTARSLPSPFQHTTVAKMKAIMLADHDYCLPGSEGNASLDHDYCDNKPPQQQQKEEQPTGTSPAEEKQKKKRRSSSSDSSSDSDSNSSCSCGSNCSCSNISSSSSSSDSGSGSSRDRRKERKKVLKKRKPQVTEASQEAAMEIEVAVPDGPNDSLIHESDLDTDETATDEDFYDYNPAREASRILAEKRTQLLANLNGEDVPLVIDEPKPSKRKMKTKKKRSQQRSRSGGTTLKIVRKKTIVVPQNGDVAMRNPPLMSLRIVDEDTVHSSGESDARRPKRKRVPLKYYGFSSEEESDVSQPKKREKVEYNATIPAPPQPPIDLWKPPPAAWRKPPDEQPPTPKVDPIKIRALQPGMEPYLVRKPSFQINGSGTGQKREKLYCFCQCPYDEVSEMIACDAQDCAIEWFHFECVGIMVPPKGSWYCPDCKKKFAAENEFMMEQS